MKKKLSVIIVNYNGLKFLDACFKSIYKKLINTDFEIIVLDNNSSDDSCNFIKTHFNKIRLIESKVNLGFGKGNNEAIKYAKGEYLLLLNNDTILIDKIDTILDLIQENEKYGVVGINMLDKNRKYLPAAGNFPNFYNMLQYKKLINLGVEFKRGFFSKNIYEVDWLCGSFLLIPQKIYLEVKGFDEDYFMYVEDVDLCKKISNAGYKRIFVSNLSYIHFVGFSMKKNPFLVKGYKTYINKHIQGYKRPFVLFALFINSIVKNIKMSILNFKNNFNESK